MLDLVRLTRAPRVGALALLLAGGLPGCSMIPRERLNESQRLTQSLRTENAQLKDQMISLQAQNRDLSDRALDDLRRLTARDEAIERLERSIHSYQDDRDRLASAYRRLATSLGRVPEEGTLHPTADRRESPGRSVAAPRPNRADENETEDLSHEDDGAGEPVPSRRTADGSSP